MKFFQAMSSDSSGAAGATLLARAFGKSSARPSPQEIRIVVPLPARMQVDKRLDEGDPPGTTIQNVARWYH